MIALTTKAPLTITMLPPSQQFFPTPNSRHPQRHPLQLPSISLCAWILLWNAVGFAQDESPDATVRDLERNARSIFRDHCLECHAQSVTEGGLRLDHREGLLSGGDSGKAIELGKSDASLLIARITASDSSRMPPNGKPLQVEQIQILRRFIDENAPWGDEPLADPRLNHWAWKNIPPKIDVPNIPPDTEATTPIDRFLVDEMNIQGITPLPHATREALIRRLNYDMLGTPPTPDEVDRFLNDDSYDAWERLVDQTLASPQYGERWARHWLDIAHYADTHGFERDQRRDHAWPYRDWVIDAFNSDLPFDTFLQHQIAGDVLQSPTDESTIASSFLAVGPWDFVGQIETPSPIIKRLARADDLDDIVTQVMTSVCGLTIHCARCHDHKLDPIRQSEYYSLTAIFSGVKRGDRVVSESQLQSIESKRQKIKTQKDAIDQELLQLTHGLSLADIVGGGNGFGTGKLGAGFDPNTGQVRLPSEKAGFLDGVVANRLNPTNSPWIDSVFVPNGSLPTGSADASDTQVSNELKISTTGIVTTCIPPTDSKVWDAIRNGPVNSQFSTSLSDTECSPPSHSMLALHANAGITFRLKHDELSKAFVNEQQPSDPPNPQSFVFTAKVGYFGQTPTAGADVHVLVDGNVVFKRLSLGRNDGLQDIQCELGPNNSFLTLIATDAGNGISHDQVCFIDASVAPLHAEKSDGKSSQDKKDRIEALRKNSDSLANDLKSLPEPKRVYGVKAETPTQTRRMHRGNPEDLREPVKPSSVSCVGPILSDIETLDEQSTDAQRRIALAHWLTSAENPLPARVMVNRLWQHHFGKGLVATPSDFGLGGATPSHPELLDWLAQQLQTSGWSIKRIHRMILLSDAYQRSSSGSNELAATTDNQNRLLWRQNPRRLDAESLRDAMLCVSGSLNRTMYGPGYRDFDYQEEYAPVYKHRVFENSDVFRRSIYRFVVRTTPHPFLTTLDCPNPATLTPVRNTTTTAIQSLATLNNAFVLQQSEQLENRIKREFGENPEAQARHAIRLAFGRQATDEEIASGAGLIQEAGLFQLCRILLNTNEFVYVD